MRRVETVVKMKHLPRNIILLLPVIVSLFAGCDRERATPVEINLPSTPVLAIDTSWAVITSSHLRLREQPEEASRIVTTLWRGYVLEVVSKQDHQTEVEGATDYWYQINFGGLQGWVFGAYLAFYPSREAAEAAGESLRQ